MLGKYCILGACLAEIVFFLYKTGEAMLDAIIRPFVISAVCKDLTRDMVIVSHAWTPRQVLFMNGTLDPCEYLQELPGLEGPVQTRAATFLMFYRILVNIPAVVLGLFCGAWSDRTGRKLPMMIPSIGSTLAVLLYMLGIVLEEHTLMIIMFGALIQGILGKSSVITMAVNSYISDTTFHEDRTRKLGKLLAMNFFGLFVGSLLAGGLQDISSLQVSLVVVSIFHAASLLTVVLCMDESIHDKLPSEEGFDPKYNTQPGLFSLQGVKESVRSLVKPREDGKRTIVLVAFVGMFLNQICKVGEQDVTVLFVQKPPLSWEPSGYGYLSSVDYAGMGLCLLLLLPVLSTFLHINDMVIVLIGLTCKLVRTVWAGFCTQTWMVYVSVVIGSAAGIITSGLRSILSKAVNEDETGKVFALASSAETAAKLIGSVVFVNIYAATLDIWPGVAYISAAMVTLVLIILMVWLYKDQQLVSKYRFSSSWNNGAVATTNFPTIREPEQEETDREFESLLPLSASSASLIALPATSPCE
ncbi:proton-coupled folate transporter [Biomphalaria glabrata]|uniref:Proton-coupled folate transporter-like n=1 Tax=Biomphalaria glabrata TaxID=6526 RepID=A0A9W2YKA6_BIOGL|nr:proton-coupled folate transporter-like [Biomphalaria glabrata]KAI8749365.1 proton-coupled folate transporter [Biomphalaria glabrata]KAI8753909.1 proton-coupled folate transporter-like [Biomphalaria glabrata]